MAQYGSLKTEPAAIARCAAGNVKMRDAKHVGKVNRTGGQSASSRKASLAC
jgi:hypothetical protein